MDGSKENLIEADNFLCFGGTFSFRTRHTFRVCDGLVMSVTDDGEWTTGAAVVGFELARGGD